MPETRLKRKAPKVKTGCLTCKARHLKCDETKPVCLRCVRSNIDCEGYPAPPKAWFFEFSQQEHVDAETAVQPKAEVEDQAVKAVVRSRHRQSNPQIVSRTSPRLSAPIGSGYPFSSSEEQRAFVYYLEKTCPVVTVYSDPETWRVVFPQFAWKHKAIKHAIIAVAMLDECSQIKSRKPQEDAAAARALYHANISIRALLTENPSIEIILSSGLLFYLLESLAHNAARAVTHVHSTVKILDQYKARLTSSEGSRDPSAEAVIKYLEPALRIALKFVEVITQPAVGRQAIDHYCSASFDIRSKLTRPGVQEKFLDFKDAREHLGGFADKISQMRSIRGLGEIPDPEEVKELGFIHFHFLRLFAPFPDIVAVHRFLNIHHQILMMIIEDHISPYQAPWFDASASSDLALGDELVAEICDLTMNPDVREDRNYQIEVGLIPPLFYMATSHRCTRYSRLAAISALRSLCRTEGAWNSCMASKLAQTILDIEESNKERVFDPILSILSDDDDLELWISFKTTGLSVHGDMLPVGIRGRVKTAWTHKEVEWLPDNITEVAHNFGYQSYFSNATNDDRTGTVQ